MKPEQMQQQLDAAQMNVMRIVMSLANQIIVDAQRIAELEAQLAQRPDTAPQP